MIHIRLCNHGTHRLLDVPLLELEASVFIPDSLEVENRPSEMYLQEAEGARVCYGCRGGGIMIVRWEDEIRRFY
jgi:hypothetical protein